MAQTVISGIVCELEYKTVKNVNLRVRRDGAVHVSAPHGTPVSFLEAFIGKHAERIRAMQAGAAGAAGACRFWDGMCLPHRGGSITLRIAGTGALEAGTREAVENTGVSLEHIRGIGWYGFRESAGELYVHPECAGDEAVEKIWRIWQRKYGWPYFREEAGRTGERFRQVGLSFQPELRVRDMISQWGSCIPAKRVITLNSRLLGYPPSCLEYVAVHEFSHFFEPNHSERFYRWMDRMLPGWQEQKKILSGGEHFGRG